MYKFVLTLVAIIGISFSMSAALSDSDIDFIRRTVYASTTIPDNAELLQRCASLKTDVAATNNKFLKRAWALLKTIGTIRGNSNTMQQIIDTHTAALVEIGLDANQNAYEFNLYRKRFNSAITDEIINAAKDRFSNFDATEKERTVRSYAQMLFDTNEYNDGCLALKDAVTSNPKCIDEVVEFYFRSARMCGGEGATEAAAIYLNKALTDQLPASCAQYVQYMLSILIRDTDNPAQLKQQLGVIRIIYTNKLATEDGRVKWNTFVSVIDNTWRSL